MSKDVFTPFLYPEILYDTKFVSFTVTLSNLMRRKGGFQVLHLTWPRSNTLFKFSHQASVIGASKQSQLVVLVTVCCLLARFQIEEKTPSVQSPDDFIIPNIKLRSSTARTLMRSSLCNLDLLLPSSCFDIAYSFNASTRFSMHAVLPLPSLLREAKKSKRMSKSRILDEKEIRTVA